MLCVCVLCRGTGKGGGSRVAQSRDCLDFISCCYLFDDRGQLLNFSVQYFPPLCSGHSHPPLPGLSRVKGPQPLLLWADPRVSQRPELRSVARNEQRWVPSPGPRVSVRSSSARTLAGVMDPEARPRVPPSC